MFSAGLALSTKKNYEAGSRRYLSFRDQYCVSQTFAVTEPILTRFVAFLFESRLTGATVKNYLAAVRYTQIAMGLGDPEMSDIPVLDYVVKGLMGMPPIQRCVPGFPSLPTTFTRRKLCGKLGRVAETLPCCGQ